MSDHEYCLVIDDAMTFLVNHNLRKAGLTIDIESARDGRDAIDRIEDLGTPSFITLDLRMPRLDGFGFLDQCVKNGWDMPVVAIVSSSTLDEDREKALGYPPVIAFLEKPPAHDQLRDLLQHRRDTQSTPAKAVGRRSTHAPAGA